MKKYRSAALALAACAASLSVAACSSGSPAASSSTATSAASQSAAATATGAAIPGRMLAVKGSLGSFPVPAGAKIGENMAGGSSVVIIFGAITPPDVSRFYATALPKAGYTVTINTTLTKAGDTGVIIEFSGHGYKGNIDALVKFPYSLAVVGDTDVTTILFSATK